MKLLSTFSLFILISFASRSQNFILNFEDTAVINQVYYTDTILDPQHIWQIGKPNKPGFDSAFSPPNTVVTLLDSTLPPNVNASFIIKTQAVGYAVYYQLEFKQKFDFNSLHSGGCITYSIDSGQTWFNIDSANYIFPQLSGINMTVWENFNHLQLDTLNDGNLYETGSAFSWDSCFISYGCYSSQQQYRNIAFWFKFTVFSDSIASNHNGWIIDDITYSYTRALACPLGINEINSSHIKVYPDPVTDGFILSLTGAGIQDYSISIMDLTGRELLYREGQEPEVSLKRGCTAAGSYVIKVTDRQTGNTMEKRVVFE